MRKVIALIGMLWIMGIVVLGGSSLHLEENGQKIPVEAAAASMEGGTVRVALEGGDYCSFTKAVYETYDSGREIVVYPGTYDIRKEYEELFDITELNDQTELGHLFQYGVRIRERTVRFMPGARLYCVWDFPTDYSARFSPVYMAENAKIYGMDLYAEGMEYAVHDDVWRTDIPYVNEYHYCRIVGRRLFGGNCIGGGVTRNTRIVIDNCYIDNGVEDSVTVRYHNTDYENGQGDIWISNSWFNGKLALSYYGISSHLNVYVNGCEAERIETMRETVDSVVENIDLYEWNNETR